MSKTKKFLFEKIKIDKIITSPKGKKGINC